MVGSFSLLLFERSRVYLPTDQRESAEGAFLKNAELSARSARSSSRAWTDPRCSALADYQSHGGSFWKGAFIIPNSDSGAFGTETCNPKYSPGDSGTRGAGFDWLCTSLTRPGKLE